MSIKMSVVRSTVQGEQVMIDVLQCNAVTGEQEYASLEAMHKEMQAALDFCDIRVYEMRQRGIEGYGLRHFCPPEAWAYVQDMLDFMAGRQDLDLITRRWQSRVEETAELEAGRLAALEQHPTAWNGVDDL